MARLWALPLTSRESYSRMSPCVICTLSMIRAWWPSSEDQHASHPWSRRPDLGIETPSKEKRDEKALCQSEDHTHPTQSRAGGAVILLHWRFKSFIQFEHLL